MCFYVYVCIYIYIIYIYKYLWFYLHLFNALAYHQWPLWQTSWNIYMAMQIGERYQLPRITCFIIYTIYGKYSKVYSIMHSNEYSYTRGAAQRFVMRPALWGLLRVCLRSHWCVSFSYVSGQIYFTAYCGSVFWKQVSSANPVALLS